MSKFLAARLKLWSKLEKCKFALQSLGQSAAVFWGFNTNWYAFYAEESGGKQTNAVMKQVTFKDQVKFT